MTAVGNVVVIWAGSRLSPRISRMSTFLPITIRSFRLADEEQVLALWAACELLRPWNDPRKDIARKLRVSRSGFS